MFKREVCVCVCVRRLGAFVRELRDQGAAAPVSLSAPFCGDERALPRHGTLRGHVFRLRSRDLAAHRTDAQTERGSAEVRRDFCLFLSES